MIAKLIESLLIYLTTGSKNNSLSQPSVSPGVKEDEGYYIWNKGDNLALSPYFSQKEFTCHCSFPDCKKQRISKVLIEKLGTIRKELKQPLIVTSAFRCVKYQTFLRAAGVSTVVAQLSQHELGNAVDVVPKDGKLAGFEQICAKQFEAIGIAKNFLHLDLRIGKIRRWAY